MSSFILFFALIYCIRFIIIIIIMVISFLARFSFTPALAGGLSLESWEAAIPRLVWVFHSISGQDGLDYSSDFQRLQFLFQSLGDCPKRTI